MRRGSRPASRPEAVPPAGIYCAPFGHKTLGPLSKFVLLEAGAHLRGEAKNWEAPKKAFEGIDGISQLCWYIQESPMEGVTSKPVSKGSIF